MNKFTTSESCLGGYSSRGWVGLGDVRSSALSRSQESAVEKPFGVNSRVGTSRFRLSCFVKVKHCLSTFFGLHPLHLTGGLKRASCKPGISEKSWSIRARRSYKQMLGKNSKPTGCRGTRQTSNSRLLATVGSVPRRPCA